MQIGRVILLVLVGAGIGASQTCETCHTQSQKLPQSAHAGVTCDTCHPGHEKVPHPAERSTLACETCHSAQAGEIAVGVHGRAQKQGKAAPNCSVCHGDAHEVARPGTTPFRRHMHETCGMCHSEVAQQFRSSVHGQAVENGVRQAPVCTDCHGEHAIERPAPGRIRETCSHCHGNVALSSRFGLPADRILSYEASFHGLAARAGSQTVANCGSCHGIHLILPSSDPKSSTNPANLPATCGHCHPGAGRRFSLGPVHITEGRGESRAVVVVRRVYLVLIPLVIGLCFLHNIGDWLRKLGERRRGFFPRHADPPGELRMFGWERAQHGLLAVSFIVLAWTGFALKYPAEFWARPLVAWESSWPVRGTVHRVAAGVFLATAALHLIALAASVRLRSHWTSLWPRRADVPEALAAFAYNLGLRSTKPSLSPHSYIEKAEYWAVVWGAVIMSGSGVLLWANTFFLARLPKIFMDLATVVHFYEAVLAALAIVVWHFYFVIFDPDVYPMDTAWLNGRSPQPRQHAGGSKVEEKVGEIPPQATPRHM